MASLWQIDAPMPLTSPGDDGDFSLQFFHIDRPFSWFY